MPFTTAHTALVIPLKKMWPRYLSLTGLMAGAMSPDLIYFLQLTTVSRGLGHSWLGLFLVCLPAGVAFSFAFHRLFKYNFIYNLPSPLDKALSGLAESTFRVVTLRSWAVLMLSVLIGALSHFFWDSFTHADGVIARAVPFLTAYTTIGGVPVLNAKIAQHISTVAGILGLILGLWKGRLLPAAASGFLPRRSSQKQKFWITHVAVATVFAVLVVVLYARYLPGHPVPRGSIFGLAGWAGFFYSVGIYTVRQKRAGMAEIAANSR